MTEGFKVRTEEEKLNSLRVKNKRKLLGGKIYLDITEHINRKTYLLEVPLYYRSIPEVFMDETFMPFYDTEDKVSTGRGMYTTAHMIDMRYHNVRFRFIHYEDILHVKAHLDIYLKELKGFIDDSDVAKDYYDKALKFNNELITNLKKLIRNKKLLDTLNLEPKDIENLLDGSFFR